MSDQLPAERMCSRRYDGDIHDMASMDCGAVVLSMVFTDCTAVLRVFLCF